MRSRQAHDPIRVARFAGQPDYAAGVASPSCPPRPVTVTRDSLRYRESGTGSGNAQLPATTATGVYRSVVVPSPSWPSTLRPQHRRVPSPRTAQVW